MKTALCYSGQINGFREAIGTQQDSYYMSDMDIYAVFSNLISQRVNLHPKYPHSGKVHQYCPANIGWRKNQSDYGIIYDACLLPKKIVTENLKKYNPVLEEIHEDLKESLEDKNLDRKWDWLRKRQLYKMYKCNSLLPENTYDVVIRSRYEFAPSGKINIQNIVEQYDNIDNKIFLFGGWDCVPPMIFMDKYMCDGFAFGSQKSMNVFTSLYLQEDPYPYDPKYEECWLKYGDNVEYQLEQHLKANNIEIVYIGNKRSMYHNWR